MLRWRRIPSGKDEMNKVFLIGNITNDLELKKTQTNKSYISFTIAVNEGYGDKKITDFIEIRAWEKTAELVSNYCRKGSKICVDGKVRTDIYEKDGRKVKNTYILAGNVEFLDPRQEPRKVIETRPKWEYGLGDEGKDITGHIDPNDLPFF